MKLDNGYTRFIMPFSLPLHLFDNFHNKKSFQIIKSDNFNFLSSETKDLTDHLFPTSKLSTEFPLHHLAEQPASPCLSILWVSGARYSMPASFLWNRKFFLILNWNVALDNFLLLVLVCLLQTVLILLPLPLDINDRSYAFPSFQ